MNNPTLTIKQTEHNQIQSACLTKNEFGFYALIVNLKSKFLDYRIYAGRTPQNKDMLAVHFEGADDKGESVVTLLVEPGTMSRLHRLEEMDGDQLILQFIPTNMLLKHEVVVAVKDE